jgi:putative DNA primase/helicase
MGRIFMSCNDLPAISSMDEGTWRRICVLPHVAKFVPADVPTNPSEHIHHRDPLLDSKITRWRPYFAGMLVWYYENRYLRSGLKEPTQVTSASNKYKEENDSFAAFSQDCLVKDVGGDVRLNDVLARYKEWCKYNTTRKQLQKKDIQQKLEEKFGKPVSDGGRMNVFVGVRLVAEGEEEDVSGGYIGHAY